VEAGDVGEPVGEKRVLKKLKKESRSRSKNFNHKTFPKIIENTVRDEGNDLKQTLCGDNKLENKYSIKMIDG
jgi:chorismate mutase